MASSSNQSSPNLNLNDFPDLPPTGSPKFPRHPYMNSKIIITSLIILVVIIFFIIAFHVYARLFWRRRRHVTSRGPNQDSHGTSTTRGLDKAIVDTLPTFTYTTPLYSEGGDVVSVEPAGTGGVECAVCLIEFQDNDACRLLPKCNHSFHTECIDKWFLSNTTCPMCRTSAEAVDSGNAHHVEISAERILPHQDISDEMQRSMSSPTDRLLSHQNSSNHIQRPRSMSAACISLPQDIINHIQRSRSSSFLGGEQQEGPRQHVHGMLAHTSSSRFDARYAVVGEGMHNIDTMSGSVRNDVIDRHGGVERDHSHTSNAGEALMQRLHLPNWRRSVSDRFLNMRQSVQFPTNVLFWGNQSQGSLRSNSEHWQVGGRSLPRIIIDGPRPQDGFLASRSASSSPVRCCSTSEHPRVLSPSMQRQPSRLGS